MCRSCSAGGRRCGKTATTRAAERAAARRYYARSKARRKIAELRGLNIPAMDDLDCPVTYHLGRDLDLGRPDPTESAGAFKPPGLWTSPGRVDADGSVKTAWMEWSVIGGQVDPVGDETLYVIRPKPGAVILRIDSPADIRAIGEAFPQFVRHHESGGAAYRRGWQAIKAAGVDAVLATSRGAHAHHAVTRASSRQDPAASFAHALYGWDVASICWFSNATITADSTATPGTYKPLAPDDEGYNEDFPDVHRDVDFGTYVEGRPTTRRPGGAAARAATD